MVTAAANIHHAEAEKTKLQSEGAAHSKIDAVDTKLDGYT